MARERDDGADIRGLLSEMLVKRDSFARSAENEDGHVTVLA